MLEPDGERFIPEFMGGQLIEAEHVVRYALAAELCKGRKVLDAGCGVGWGTELLLGAGADSASGVDLSPDAIENARARVPGADFREGNLAQLPFEDDVFDLVVCFEAIEHVEQQEKVFDELVRVLAPGGILMVSSPNPRVYPAGNPFHIHELVPEELVEAARSRLQHVTLLLQHEQMASMLVQGDSLAVGRSDEVLLRVVRPLRSGSDPYSLIVASDGDLPELPTIVGSAPSVLHELLAERTVALAESAQRLRTRLEEARYPRRDAPVPAEWEREQTALRRDREQLGARLLECEQLLAAATQAATAPHPPGADLEVADLRTAVAQFEAERADMLASTSWRLTKPLRMLGQIRSRKS
ncbi:MAG TPA: class I SAM-dependent methyltransferase [Acidimicrobiales bacterium]|jgi:ubiquinone/menaquinone biosynthesis C-methylase UbiE|nr:class I SAM-dependent methyltransferase [Acidimicrobiales bacterium]